MLLGPEVRAAWERHLSQTHLAAEAAAQDAREEQEVSG